MISSTCASTCAMAGQWASFSQAMEAVNLDAAGSSEQTESQNEANTWSSGLGQIVRDAMPKHTPFHESLAPFNETGIWKNWSGYLVAPNYQYSVTTEYYSIRNSVAVLDTSALFKYRFSGNDSTRLLEHLFVRDIRKCSVGRAQYTLFCDDQGYVIQDGVVLHVSENEFLFTAAEPALRYFRSLAKQLDLSDVQIDDVSEDFGILAIQGPHSHSVLQQLTDQVTPLKYFRLTKTVIKQREVVVSRTGYTGDLGYEIWVRRDDASTVWDAIMSAGEGYNITPIGTTALKMARVEAGLLLMDVDFHSSRYAWSVEQKETPHELGFGWMFKGLKKDDRKFIGRSAIENEIENSSSRWKTVGLGICINDYERLHLEAGIFPPKHNLYRESTISVYRTGAPDWDYAGYVSSFLYSPLLNRPIAIAKLPLDLSQAGTEVELETQIIRRPTTVKAKVESLPFFDPERRTAMVNSKSAQNREAAHVQF